jgi:hypothetical protein
MSQPAATATRNGLSASLLDGSIMSNCPEYDQLAGEADRILRDLGQATTLLLELFRTRDHAKFVQLDKELEQLVGEKERALGALRQHAKEHKCQVAP